MNEPNATLITIVPAAKHAEISTALTHAKKKILVPATPFASFQITTPSADAPNHFLSEILIHSVNQGKETQSQSAQSIETARTNLLALTTTARIHALS